MIIAQSRFRVVNGMEDEVAEAFLNRPGLVDTAEGFLGLEVFTDAEDPAAFYLVTRWSNAACFEQWHNGPAHRASHRFMPKGLKLDPKHTQIVRMERIAPADAAPPMADRVRDAAPLLARFLPNADTLHCIEASRAGEVYDANHAVLHSLNCSMDELRARGLWDCLVATDAARLQEWVAAPRAEQEERLLLNFRSAEDIPFTLACGIETYPDSFVLLGEPPVHSDALAQAEMVRLSNELAQLNREHVRQNRELAAAKAELQKAMQELEQSHWHLRKIEEFMPICCRCHKVRSNNGEAPDWMNLVDYLSANEIIFSHGLCPDCYETELAVLQEMLGKQEDHV